MEEGSYKEEKSVSQRKEGGRESWKEAAMNGAGERIQWQWKTVASRCAFGVAQKRTNEGKSDK